MTDTERVVAYFRTHPDSSRGEAQAALGWIHVTARMSDARKLGVEFIKYRDGKAYRFRVVERPQQLTAFG